jgi:hypothetical protein
MTAVGTVVPMHGFSVLLCDPAGPRIDGTQGALDVIGEAWGLQADFVVIPVARLDESFFTLSSGVAGEVVQKFVNYKMPVAIVGSIAAQLRGSSALRAFVHESNNGSQVWFMDDHGQLAARLAGHTSTV